MKTYLVRNIKTPIDVNEEELKAKVGKKVSLNPSSFTMRRYRESVDARKGTVEKNYQVLIDTLEKPEVKKNQKNDLVEWEVEDFNPQAGDKKLAHPPVIIGAGPTGLFSALLLAEAGFCPIVIEQGKKTNERATDVEHFWKTGELNPSSNVQFGEGGAGTFSDGKLTSRSKNPRSYYVLSKFVEFGGPKEILWEQYPHVGTDVLREVVKNIRKHIISLGGQFYFSEKLKDIEFESDSSGRKKVKKVITNKQELESQVLILAIGHSARNTFLRLNSLGVPMENKAFAMGFRIEHKQSLIEKSQYGAHANSPHLPKASYRLTNQSKEIGGDQKQRGVYTFCMCPGGYVVNASSEENSLCVNGMSYYARGGSNANSAVLTTLPVEELGPELFSGVALQRQVEEKAFELGGGGYKAPVQLVGAFLKNRPSDELGEIKPSIEPGFVLTDLSQIYPPSVTRAIQESLKKWDQKIHGFAADDAVLTGVEARSSSPVRILRDRESYESTGISGLFPAGEGAGYAGGIVSSALDGLNVSEKIIETYHFNQ